MVRSSILTQLIEDKSLNESMNEFPKQNQKFESASDLRLGTEY